MKKVGIILINYKDYARKYLKACRDTLRLQSYLDFQVYIIDNASSDDTLSYLKNTYPEAIILPRTDGNYCAANNLGMKRAIGDGCQYLVAANMDTEFEIDWLKELVIALNNNSQVGVVQSLIMLYPRNEEERLNPRINTTGNLIHFLFFGFTNNYNLKKSEAVFTSTYPEIDYASGCSFIIRQEIFTEIGGYNEDYYMYHDDLDISLKTRLAGYKVVLAPKSVMWHKYEFERSVKMLYYMERNRVISFFSFYPIYIFILLSPFLFFMSVGMTFFSMMNGWFITKLKVTTYFFKPAAWQLISRNRQHYHKLSKQSFKRIASSFVGKIEFQEINNPILEHFVNPVFNFYWQLIKKII